MKFKDKLKQIRKARGLSQQALADAIHISRSAIAKWENGLGYPNPDALESLISYFGTDTHFFDSNQTEEDISSGTETTPTRAGGLFCKWFTLVAVAAILLFGCFCLLTQWKCITLPIDGVSVKEIYMFPDGRLIYSLENVPNDVWCSEWDFINAGDGSIYKMPKRSVIEIARNSQPNQLEVEMLIDPNELNAHNAKADLPRVTKWYLGVPGNAILIWEEGMEVLPATKELLIKHGYNFE